MIGGGKTTTDEFRGGGHVTWRQNSRMYATATPGDGGGDGCSPVESYSTPQQRNGVAFRGIHRVMLPGADGKDLPPEMDGLYPRSKPMVEIAKGSLLVDNTM
eukprot:scaffold461_cov321-Pavlova_lutheri.AAC.23